MAKLSKEDFMTAVKNIVGDNTNDEAIKFVEDMSDTYNELEQSTAGQEDYKKKYEDNDKAWREKYRSRFFSTGEEDNKDNHEKQHEDENDDVTIDSLFKESEG
jgi:hypothetical protein